jgi:hypothetical protein
MSPFAGYSIGHTVDYHQHRQQQQHRHNHREQMSFAGRCSWPGEVSTLKPRRFNFPRFVSKEWASVMFWVLCSVALAVAVDHLVSIDVAKAYLLPEAVSKHLAPALFVSNGIILLFIDQWFGSCPNLICRLCEYQMGRVNKLGLLSAVVVHLIGSLAFIILMKRGLPRESLSVIFALDYTRPSVCSCACEFVKETMVSALFPVVYFVAPTLFRLNRFPVWLIIFCLYPLYVTSIDGDGRGSLLSPTVALMTGRGLWRVVAQLVGGLLGGRIMSTCFPDDPKM